ncbi:rhomboid family intramembrane serine protease [Trichloromonas sp.]|uniref:rhomboid family intramembrane serine protease n=1 Tax=Trichloromonas sp. TaxID=3069249 RepID=UPI003D81B0E6
MLLPIGDTPNPPGTPYANYLLIGLNVAVFLLIALPLTAARPDPSDPLLYEYLQVAGARDTLSLRVLLEHLSAYDLFVFRHGFRPASPSLSSLFTSLFLHGGWMHLLGNMLFLWIFGDNVEHRLGPVRYLLAYLAAGVAATLFFALFVPASQVPLVGASGAISGVLGFYFLWFPRNRVKTFVFLFPFIMNTFLVPARLVLGFYLLIDNLLPFLLNGGGSGGVAHGAHIGGFVAGTAMAFGIDRLPGGLRQLRRRTPLADDEVVREARVDTGIATRIERALDEGELERALALYPRIDGRQGRAQLGSASMLALGELLLAHREYDQALSLFRRFIAERPADAALDRAYLGAGRALMHKPRCVTSAYHYFLAALDVARSRELADEVRLHLHAIERLGEKGTGRKA